MSFTVYPAIDMRGGKCVRLIQGDYSQETVYGDSPFDMAEQFANDGAAWIHMVDLDGAKAGEKINHPFVVQAAKKLTSSIQIGGGIRSEADIEFYLENGVDRVILGSIAVTNRDFVKDMLKKYGAKLAIGIDAKEGYVATHGWLSTSSLTAVELGKELAEAGAETFICTDIAKDGMLSGPNIESLLQIAEVTGKNIIASGGISSLEDLRALRKLADKGIKGAIVGKALYEQRFTLREAIEEVSS
ncbi:MAG TPA: 1-(5-phosphoribosyl)-5-[(5-phosphoribosylamino)methylideneamino]imidazole-4-carboxamide isomerase [Bacillus sp. (in: firmicutes)]|nr:1-(5-phosphoribosyl)-5-[(5-phosphoribosylamino)methylideneamino]imidazole-4-carboxamide isomerase [Bacillus sp. (in: firmicutes)]